MMENLEDLLNETIRKINFIKDRSLGKQEGEIKQELEQIEGQLCMALSNYGVEYRIFESIKGRFYDLTRNLSDSNTKAIGEIVLESSSIIKTNFSPLMKSKEMKEEQDDMLNNVFSKTRRDVEIIKQDKKQTQTLPMREYIKETYTNILASVVMQQFGRSASEIAHVKYIVEDSYEKCMETMAERYDTNRSEVTQIIQDEVESLNQDVKRTMNGETGKILDEANEEIVRNDELIETVETILSELGEIKPNVEDTGSKKNLPNSLDAYVLTGEDLEQFNKRAIKLAEEYESEEIKTDKDSEKQSEEIDIEDLFA